MNQLTDIETQNVTKTEAEVMKGKSLFRKGMWSEENRLINEPKILAFVISAKVFRVMIRIPYELTPLRLQNGSIHASFSLKHRKISNHPSSLIAFYQSVMLWDRINGRLGEKIFGQLS